MIYAAAGLDIQATQVLLIFMAERSDTTNIQSSVFNLQ
jgi:hypothetical protein